MTTFLLFAALPTVLSVAAIVTSSMISRRARSGAQWFTTSLVFLANGCSLLVLYWIFGLGAWPTYLPHIVIGITLGVVTAQALFLRRSRA